MRIARGAGLVREAFRTGDTVAANDLGYLYLDLEELSRASAAERAEVGPLDPAELALQALEIARSSVDTERDLAWMEWQTCLHLRDAGRLGEARELVERAAELYAPDNPFTPYLMAECADIARYEARFEDGFSWYGRGQALIPERTEDHVLLVARTILLGVGGDLELELGNLDRVSDYYEPELRLATELGEDALRFTAELQHLNFAMAQEDYAGVERLAADLLASPFGRDLPQPDRAQVQVRVAMARIEGERIGRPTPGPDPGALLEEALALDGLLASERVLALSNLASHRLDRGEHDAAAEALASLRALEERSDIVERHEPLYAALEARLAIERPESGREELAGALERLEASWPRFLESWDSAPERAGGVGFLHFGERNAVIAELVRLSVLVHGPERGAELGLRRLAELQAKGSLARRLHARGSDPSALRAALAGEDRAVLAYVPGKVRSHLLVVDAAGVRHHPLAPLFELQAAQREFEEQLGRALFAPRVDPALERSLEALAALLLPPEVRGRLAEWDEVAVLGLGSPGRIPFEAFAAEGGGRLGERVSLSYLPSLPVGLELSERAPAPRALGEHEVEYVLVGAPPVPREKADDYDDIALDEEASAGLTLTYGAGRARALLGTDAAVSALKSAVPAGAAVLHLITHGEYDPRREQPIGLMLAGGTLWPWELETIALPPVVVLGACKGARGPMRRGDDGRAGLGGACFAGGAQVVLVGHRALELHEHLALSETFNARLAAGASPARALRDARRAAAREGDAQGLRAALFHVVGLGSAPVYEERERVAPLRPMALGAALALAVLLAGAWVGRARRSRALTAPAAPGAGPRGRTGSRSDAE